MKTLLTFILCTVFYVTGAVESAQAPAAQQSAPPAAAADPKLSDALHAKIRDVQYKQQGMQGQYVQLNKQMQDLQKNFLASIKDLNALTDQAYQESGVDRSTWELNMETLVFAKKAPPAPPPAATPVPAKKKS